MDIEIGGVSTGAENIQQLLDHQGDIIAANSWLPLVQVEEERPTEQLKESCSCGSKCSACDGVYLYS